MSAKPFLDTTVLIYAVTQDERRSAIAEELLSQGGSISVQVLNEFAAVARRKLKLSWPAISEALDSIRSLCEPVRPISLATHEQASALASRFGYQIYDALILAAALESECTTVYSEDMQHGQRIQGLTIQNPFRKLI